jgi:hypothetical protein
MDIPAGGYLADTCNIKPAVQYKPRLAYTTFEF